MKSILSLTKQLGSLASAKHFTLVLFALISITAKANTPTFSVVFSPDTIAPNQISTMTYTIDNSANASGVSSVSFTNTLPANVTIAATPNALSTCTNGFYNAPANQDTITFSDYRIGAGESCTFSLDVTSSTVGTHTNTTGNLSTSGGTVAGATDDLIVDNSGLGLSMAFGASTITPEEITTLTYTLDASGIGANIHSTRFNHTFTGIEISPIPNLTTDCTSIVFAPSGGDTSINVQGIALNAGSTCSIQFDVTSSTAGSHTNATTAGSYYEFGDFSPKTVPVASATISVELPLMYMNFPASSSPGSSVSLTYNITNFERTDITDLNFTNNLNATLSGLAATALPADNFCGTGSTMSGSSTLSISNINLPSGQSCSFSVTVLVPANAAAGSYTNSTSTINITRDSTTTIAAVTNTLSVQAAPTITATFDNSSIAAGSDVIQTFTITNTDNANSVTDIAFTQNIAGVIPLASISALPAANSCGTGSTFTATADSNSTAILNVQGANLTAGSNCTFSVTITTPTSAATNSYDFVTSTLSGAIGGNSVYATPITTSLTVTSAPTLSFSLENSSFIPGSTATANFSLNFSDTAAANATNIGFSLDLDSSVNGLAISGGNQSDICGSGSTITGTGIMTFAGGTLAPGDTCSFSVTISIPATANLQNSDFGDGTLTTSTITAQSSSLNLTRATESESFVLTGLTFAMTLAPSTIIANNSIVATYTFNNATGAPDASAISFSQNYNSAISGMAATALPASPCNGASISGTNLLNFSGGSLTGGESCSFNVTIAVPNGIADGDYNLATSPSSSTVQGTNITLSQVSSILTIESLTTSLTTTADQSTNDSPIPININFTRDVNNFTSSDLQISNGTVASFTGSGKDYTATITPTADGTVTIDVPAGVANDAVYASTTNPAATQLSIEYSATPTVPVPSIAVSAPSVTDTNTGPVTYTVTYTNANQVNLTANAISLNATGTSASVAVTNGDTNTPTVTLSNITGDGTLSFNIAASTARNEQHVAEAYGPSSTFNVDNTAPTITISDTVSDTINTAFTATFTFSETVNGFTQNDIVTSNAGLSDFTTLSSTVYTALVTPTTEGPVTLNVPAAVATDNASNNNTAGNQLSVTYDTSDPTLVVSATNTDFNSPFTATFTFNEDISGLDISEITVTNGAASNLVTTSPSIYQATITPTSDGQVDVSLAASLVNDNAGNPNVASNILSIKYDTTAVTPSISADKSLSNSDFTITVTFDEPVTGFTINDLSTDNGSFSNFIATSNTVYSAKLQPNSDGDVAVDVPANSAVDPAGNANLAAQTVNLTYDTQGPTLVVSGPTSAINADFTATFTFNETVSGFTADDITVTNASLSNFATVSTSEYTALISPAKNGDVTVNVAASLLTDTIGNNNSASNLFTVEYDKQKPSVVIEGPTTSINGAFDIEIDFSKNVNGFVQSMITVTNGSVTAFNAQAQPKYQATVTPNTMGEVTVQILAAVVSDSPGNTNTASNLYTINYDSQTPTISALSPTHNNQTASASNKLAITFNEPIAKGDSNNFINLKNAANDSLVEAVAANSSAVSISDNTATITLSNPTVEKSEYYVEIDNLAFKDIAGNAFAGISGNSTWRFKVSNLPPDVVADIASVDEDTSVLIEVLANDTDANSVINPASLQIATPPSKGSVLVNPATGIVTYTPTQNLTGNDQFTYQVSDLLGKQSVPATVTINIKAINDAPVAHNDLISTSINNNVTIDVLANDLDIDSNAEIVANSIAITKTPQNGSAELIDGQIYYRPNSNFSGSDSLEYAVKDIHQAVSNNAQVFINVIDTNQPPIANNDSYTTDEDTNVTLTVLDNDTDSDGQVDITSVALVSPPSLGKITINSNGSMTYAPTANKNGTDSFTYTLKDNQGALANPATVTVTINSINDAPTVQNDTLVLLNTTLAQTINVLSNDSDVDGTIDTIAIVTQPQFGSVNIDSTSKLVTYTPAANFGSLDSFTYTATDNNALTSAIATVTISDTPINIPPVANNDQVQTNEDQFIAIDVLANDSDLNGRILPNSLTITAAPINGTASIRRSDGQIYYTPNSNFSGQDQLTYQIEDNRGDSDTAIVTITINSVNDNPVATPLSLSTDEDSSVTVTLSGSDIDGDTITYKIETSPANGNLSGTLPNLTYSPDENFAGVDSFYYVANDGKIDSNLTTVTINVTGQNDIPTAKDQTITLNEDTSRSIILAGEDIDGDTLTYQVTNQPTNGTLTGSGNALVYAGNLNFHGSDSFTFVTNDGSTNSAPATINITVAPVNDAPIANSQTLSLNEDSSLDIILFATDEDNDTLTYAITQNPTHGVLEGTAPFLTYRPNTNFNGNDSFSFSANDGSNNSPAAQINLTVASINDAPDAQDLALTTSEDLPLSINLTGSDPDNDPLTIVSRSEPQNGTITSRGLQLTYTPNSNFNGTDSFTYQLSDGQQSSRVATAAITINSINDAPIAVTDSVEQTGTAPLTINVIANDTDADGDAITLTNVTPSVGTAQIINNQLLYTPNSNFVGQTKVFYTISDSAAATAQGQVNIKIRRNNNSGNAIVQVPNDIAINATGVLTTVDLGVATATDADGTPLPVTLLTDSNHFKSGVNTVYWQATDSQGNLSIANQTVTIEPQIAIDPYQIVQEGQTATVKVSLSGPAVQYPMVIPYTISGSAQLGDDHNIQNGELILTSGTHTQLEIDLHQDQMTEGDETLIISLDPSLNLAAQHQHQLIISEQAQAPKLSLSASQNDTQSMVVNRQDGLITINVSANQPLDTFNFNWQTQADIENLSDNRQQFVFDPQSLEPGQYQFNLRSHNKSALEITTDASLSVLLQQSATSLGQDDSDQDGISDQLEGHQDSDNDGIANYLDAINNCNVLASKIDNTNSHLIVSQAGSCLRLGNNALSAQQHSAASNAITDVIITDLAQAGLSYQIVMAQQQPLVQNAIVQLKQNDQWYDFSEDANNYLMSAQGQNGVCPAPASNQWQMGLEAGHWCVQLTIEDGGINDADSAINRAISITSQVIGQTTNSLPQLIDDISATRQGTSAIIDVLANDTDPDGDNLTLTHANALFGQVSIIDSQLHYQPLNEHLGTDTIEYLASDNQSGPQSATLTITINANGLPIALDDHASTPAGQTIIIDVLSNDSDPDGDTLTLLGATSSNGTLSIINNQISYQSTNNYSGDDVINYQVGDGHGGQTIGTLIVSVTVMASDNNQTDQPTTEPTSSSGGSTHPLWLMMLGLLFIVRQQKMANQLAQSNLAQSNKV